MPKKLSIGKSFKLIDFNFYDVNCDKSTDFMIQMFGVNERGETCCIYVNDFRPMFYIKVGDNWTDSTVAALLCEIRAKIGTYHDTSILSAKLVQHHKLYGFSGGKKHNFVVLTFKNVACMNKVKGLWYYYAPKVKGQYSEKIKKPFRFQGIELESYEGNIPPLLRYFHIHNISPSGWVYLPLSHAIIPEAKTTTCTFEYVCRVSKLKPMQKETSVPYKICSFDIEASSSHGDFPVPIKLYKRLAMNMVDVFNTQTRFITDAKLLTGLCGRVILTAFGYDSVEDVDRVFPKAQPSETQLKKVIELLVKTPIQNAKILATEDNAHLLTIDKMFEALRQDTGGAEGDDSDDEPERPKHKSCKVDHSSTIMDVILSDKYERDDKIQIINETLTLTFPRLEGDKVTFIGTTFFRYGEPSTYLNHCFVLGDCAPVAGAVIESVATETDLLLKWSQLIQTENPDIIIGYNIFGFDWEFMFRRAQENHCERDFLLLSRKIGELSAKDEGGELNLESSKVVLASGEYDLKYAKMTGRLQIDMYSYFRRDFNLPSYKLDDVAGQYISDDVKYVEFANHPTFGEVTELYSKNLTGLNVGDFIHIEITGFTSDYYKDKFPVLEIVEKEITKVIKGAEITAKYNVIVIPNHEYIDTTKGIKWGMAKDDVSPQDIFRLANGSADDRAIVAKYCIQDCNLVHHLLNKIDVITNYVEMSRICSVPISFLVFRGQSIKLTSYVAKKCREKDTLMPDIEKSTDNDGYEGAIVLPPKCSMYMDNPVACVDYASLYPSSMISQNYSHDSKVWTMEYDLMGKLVAETGEKVDGVFIYDNLPGYKYIDVEFDTYKMSRKTPKSKLEKIKSGKMVCRWAQLPDNQKSIMPAILEELLKARADTRKLIKSEPDPFIQNILDKRQLGYKVTANSLYGQCGAKTSTFYERDVAASTTATGRMMIMYAKRIVEEVYGDLEYQTVNNGMVKTRAEYVYGDTDSVFFTFNLETLSGEKIKGKKALEITIEIAQDVAALCTQFLKPPMELTYEKTLMPFILLSKKRYVGMLYETDVNKGKLKYMGLSLKRRDSCDYLKDVYGEILNILMKENNIQSAIESLDIAMNNLITGAVSMDKLCITRSLRSDYKNPGSIGHKVLADRIGKRDPGNKPKPGDRIKFVFITNDNKKALLGDRVETPMYITDNRLKIDYMYYITNQLMKPLQQLFGLAVEQIWEYQNKTSAIKMYKRDILKLQDEVPDMEEYMKKKEKYCSAKIKVLLFDKFLNRIFNEKHGIQTLNQFFN